MYTYSLFIDCIICISMQSDKEMAALGGSCYVRKPFIYKIRVGLDLQKQNSTDKKDIINTAVYISIKERSYYSTVRSYHN